MESLNQEFNLEGEIDELMESLQERIEFGCSANNAITPCKGNFCDVNASICDIHLPPTQNNN